MGFFEKYLIIVNIAGCMLYLINMLLYRYTQKANVDKLLMVLSLAGGSLGILITILIFDRKAVKDNMMSRVFIICVFIIQVIILLFLNGVHGEKRLEKF